MQIDYLRRRLEQEEAAARNAADPRVRRCHLELAQRYRDACSQQIALEEAAPHSAEGAGMERVKGIEPSS